MFPSVGAMRPTGTTVIIEDVAFPVERLAEATLDLQRLLATHGYDEAIIFGHALDGNLHFVFTQDFDNAAEVERYRALHGRDVRAWSSRSTTARSRPSTAPAATSRRSSSSNGAREAYRDHARIKRAVRSAGPAQSRRDPQRRPRRAPEEPEAAARRAIRSSTSASSAASASRSARRAA